VSGKGLGLVEKHLARFAKDAGNDAMIQRLRHALSNGHKIFGPDANFYLHEAHEATLMNCGLIYEVAHPAALGKYGVKEFDLYAPEVIQRFPSAFSTGFKRYWGLE
jgi:hypothetical protein